MFLEFLAANGLSHRVVLNYISAFKYMFVRYGWQVITLEASLVKHMLDGIKLSIRHVPIPKAVFSLQQIRQIARFCDLFPDSSLFRVAFLLAFYALLHISNVAPRF